MPNTEEIKDLFLKAVEDIKDEDVQKVREHTEEIHNIIGAVLDVFGDGLQLNDVTRIGEIVGPVMKLAASFKDYKGQEKKQFVIEVVWLVYRTVDTYPDGNHNNINIPFVFGSIERKLERGILSFSAGMAVDALYGRMKEGGEV